MTLQPRHDLVTSYLARPAEALVVEGFRSAFEQIHAQEVRQTPACWQRTPANKQGMDQAAQALDNLVETLRRCATCPLRCFPAGAPNLCRDECLLLGILASIQHGDDDTLKLCLDALACPFRAPEVASAAGALAITLKALGKTLMPIPASAISDILIRSGQSQARSATLH